MHLLTSRFRSFAALLVVALAGCASGPSTAERAARQHLADVGEAYRPGGQMPSLPTLTADSKPEDFIRFALLNHPRVTAAYHDWQASVEAIAPARALPDPKVTFEADIADTLMTFMPGLMFDVMAAGKRQAMAAEATAGSKVAYRTFVTNVLRTAANVRKAWLDLAYIAETDRLFRETIGAADEALALTNAEYVTGRGMANFDKQVRLQNIALQHHVHHATLADRQVAARAKFKSALGLLPDDPDPPWPTPTLAATPLPSADELWLRARAANAEVAQMRAMVEMAVASIDVARQARRPDFSVGAMANLKDTEENPRMIRPLASISLPIWREKIAANIAAATARREAAQARVTSEELDLAAELAQMLYMVRESDRMLDYLDRAALPNLNRAMASIEAGAQSGMGSTTMISEIRLMQIDMRHERVDALRDRENAVISLSLLIADVAPVDSPLLAGNSTRSK